MIHALYLRASLALGYRRQRIARLIRSQDTRRGQKRARDRDATLRRAAGSEGVASPPEPEASPTSSRTRRNREAEA